ncbi:hypothetical protein BCR33DRAFT_26931 [Rhizoclosmatium globosum]|uniref:Uncharacterized protein n=1 Tax=Rhizoclosmatium globosum TaxID=329046 RepID=A0A1Y2AXK4_9FUNG|nr:hypothetical protein BCR33DRAFT_26931 [Rhizoclosmatium globosum]|eukprot:ORY27301.1 hypothetical protein BCR33DRAFT_26931 [Rhizoclosmatium globosum]
MIQGTRRQRYLQSFRGALRLLLRYSQQIHLKPHPPVLCCNIRPSTILLFYATKPTCLCARNSALFSMRLFRILLQLQPSRKVKQVNQINNVTLNLYFDVDLNLHIYSYNFFLLPQTIILSRHQTLSSITYSVDVCR